MKKELRSFTVTQPKHRAHHILFCKDTPFKPQVVASKKGVYQRRDKHQKPYTEK